MQPLHITVAEAKPILRAAYAAGTLSMQGSQPKAAYFDRETGNRCAIGQLFPVDDAQELEQDPNYRLASGLISDDVLVVDDRQWFIHVQRAHDNGDIDNFIAFLELIQ